MTSLKDLKQEQSRLLEEEFSLTNYIANIKRDDFPSEQQYLDAKKPHDAKLLELQIELARIGAEIKRYEDERFPDYMRQTLSEIHEYIFLGLAGTSDVDVGQVLAGAYVPLDEKLKITKPLRLSCGGILQNFDLVDFLIEQSKKQTGDMRDAKVNLNILKENTSTSFRITYVCADNSHHKPIHFKTLGFLKRPVYRTEKTTLTVLKLGIAEVK